MASVQSERVLKIPNFEIGMDLMAHTPYLRELLNAHVTEDGSVVRRKGRRVVDAGAYHSLWGVEGQDVAYAVKNGVLVRLTLDGDNLNIRSLFNFTSVNEVSFCEFNDLIYFTCGELTGKILPNNAVQSLGAPDPVIIPTKLFVAAAPYRRTEEPISNTLYCYTYVNTATGEESGASPLSTTRQLPAAMSGYAIKEYRGANRTEVYDAKGKVCETQGLRRMPTGQIIRGFKGHLLIARGNVLYWSEPLRYGLYKPSTNYILFESNITLLEPITDSGIYVGTAQGVVFLSGGTLMDIKVSRPLSPRPFEKSGRRIKDVDLPGREDKYPEAVVWLTQYGFMYGLPDGLVVNVTYDRIRLPAFERAFTGVQIENGQRRIIASVSSDVLYDTNRIRNLGEF